jgi:predicted O-methyltransferase YrrM
MWGITPDRHPVLQEMEVYAAENDFPIIGPLVGRFLAQLVHLTGAKRIFEMGSGYGYSAIWFSQALPRDGVVECTETDEDNIARARVYADRAGVGEKIMWYQGDALQSMADTLGPYDIILCDVNKDQYPRALEIAWPKLRRGGIMITDNVLWSGRIVEQNEPDDSTGGILEFNDRCYELSDALCTIMPLRDGLMLAVKV